MNEEYGLNSLVYPETVPEVEVVHLADGTMQVQINGWPDMGIVFKRGYLRYWVDYDYPAGIASFVSRVEVLGTKKINDEECYEVKYVGAQPGGDIDSPSYWYYAERGDKIFWVRFVHRKNDRTVIEEVDGSLIPMKLKPGMHWYERDTQRDATTGAIYVNRRGIEKVEGVVDLRIGSCSYQCLRLVMFSVDVAGASAHTLVEKYIDGEGLTVLRRKYMGEDNMGGRKQLQQSTWIEHDNRRYYLWYDSIFLHEL